MLTVNSLTIRVGDRLLLEDVTFTINPGDRIGLIGPNGAGKTSLLRAITGDLPLAGGTVTLAPQTTIGVLRQGFADIPAGTLADLLDIPSGGLLRAHEALDAASRALADADADPDASAATWDAASRAFEAAGGYQRLADIEAHLDRFGRGELPPSRPLAELSGGQKTRAGLAALLASRPDLLILDEPTNHLDQAALTWLTGFLRDYAGAVLAVSHDRAFLDDVVSRILFIDDRQRQVLPYPGTYTDFVAQREHEEAEAEAAWHRQQAEVARIQQDIRQMEQTSRSIEASTIDFAVRKKAAKIVRPAVVRKAKLEKLLASEDAAERPERRWTMHLAFPEVTGGPREVLLAEDLHIALGGREVLAGVNLRLRHGERVALLGENGSGKTTLFRAIMGELTPSQGRIRLGSGVRVGYFAQEQQTLRPDETALDHARRVATGLEGSLRAELHKFLFGGEMVHRPVRELSYGERARLMLALLVMQDVNCLLLDEPLNHLDITSRTEFEEALVAFGGTILMVAHDRYTVRRVATRAVRLEGGLLFDAADAISTEE